MKKQHKIDTEDTIAAISTPLGEGAIGIVRLSGKDAVKIADTIFRSKKGRLPSSFRSFTSHFGHVYNKDVVVDEALLIVMRAPKSYTKEEMVEISCHGGIIPLRKTLGLVSRTARGWRNRANSQNGLFLTAGSTLPRPRLCWI